MDNYISGNKEAWEEAFDMRSESWGADIIEKVQKGDFAYFYSDAVKVLKKYELAGKTIGQFCCNNGRELLSLVKATRAKKGVGFDIAENMVSFANDTAKQLGLPCEFVATDILEIGDCFNECFDLVLITEGALCWFKDLKQFFAVIARCMKKNGVIVIEDQHPLSNMLASRGEEKYDEKYPCNCVYSYFEHEWVENGGMYYITGKSYKSKTFTDYTHSISDILGSMCANKILITNFQEFEYDVCCNFENLSNKGLPLSMLIEGKKE